MRFSIATLIVLLPLICGCDNTTILASESMAPTIVKGERVTFDIWSNKNEHPARWDVVLFKHPNNEVLDIKRVVGLPGETISFTPEGLAIGGLVLKQPDRITSIFYKSTGKMNVSIPRTYTIADDAYFLLGDNPDGSVDSRFYGPIARKRIVGRVKDK